MVLNQETAPSTPQPSPPLPPNLSLTSLLSVFLSSGDLHPQEVTVRATEGSTVDETKAEGLAGIPKTLGLTCSYRYLRGGSASRSAGGGCDKVRRGGKKKDKERGRKNEENPAEETR
ncbi:unnamed protein product [Boreogadus saida]